jgi:hypothetical protein
VAGVADEVALGVGTGGLGMHVTDRR